MKMFSRQFSIKRTNSRGHTTITDGSNLFGPKSSFQPPKINASFKERKKSFCFAFNQHRTIVFVQASEATIIFCEVSTRCFHQKELSSSRFSFVDYVEKLWRPCWKKHKKELPWSWLRSWLTSGDCDCDCDRVLRTAIVTAIVTVTHSLVYDCVQTEPPTVTVIRVVTATRSERVFFVTTIIVTSRLAHQES